MAVTIKRQGHELSVSSPFGIDHRFVLTTSDAATFCTACDADIPAGTPFWQGIASHIQDPSARCTACALKKWHVEA